MSLFASDTPVPELARTQEAASLASLKQVDSLEKTDSLEKLDAEKAPEAVAVRVLSGDDDVSEAEVIVRAEDVAVQVRFVHQPLYT